MDESPYFFIDEEITISSIQMLLELNKKRSFGSRNYDPLSPINLLTVHPHLLKPHESSGIFRGQARDWPLAPLAYREIKYDPDVPLSDMKLRTEYLLNNYQFETFCEMASKQNNSFPKSSIERMCLAQHYGIKTPLLDWTTNILVAAYFAIYLKSEDDEDKNLEPYIYHLKDERWLKSINQIGDDLEKINYSTLIESPPLDRRIERQFSVFSYHPHPSRKPEKIPLSKYKLSGELFLELWKILEGIGFSSHHMFPDYAGLVDRIKKGYMI
jgi:hypothetical protein